MIPEPENRLLSWLIWAGLFLFLVLLILLSFFLYRLAYPVKPVNLPFVVEYADRSSQVFSSQYGKWAALKYGDIVKPGDKLRTADGEVSFKVPGKIHFRLKENSELELNAVSKRKDEPLPKVHLIRGTLLGATEYNLSGRD